jgi:hypothetical protein
MGIFISLSNEKQWQNNPLVNNLIESFVFFIKILKRERFFKIEKLTFWKNGPNIAYGTRVKEITNKEEIKNILSSVESLRDSLQDLKLVKVLKRLYVKQKNIDDYIKSEKRYYGPSIAGIIPFALEIQGKFVLANNQVPSYIKALSNTGFEEELGDIYLEFFSHFGKEFLDYLIENKEDYKSIINLMKQIYTSHIIDPKKIIIGEDQVSNLYCLGSIFFWYKKLDDYFADIDNLSIALETTGKNEVIYLLNNLGIIGLWDSNILSDFSEYRRIYKIENLRDSYSYAIGMKNFLKSNAESINLPISLKHSFLGFSPNCNQKPIASLIYRTLDAVHRIMIKSLKKEEDFKRYLEEETNKVLKSYK